MTSPEITDAAVEAQTDAEFLTRLGTDAAKWAAAFCSAYERLDFNIDPTPGDYLHAWFCNMIEAGRSAGYSEATRDANTLSHRAALAAGRADAVAAGWQTMDTAPEVGSKFIALYNDGSGAVMFYRHDDGYIDHEGADRTSVDFSKFGKWAYLPAGFELWCEMGVEPIELPEWKGPGSALVSAPAAPIDGTGRFKPCITVNEEAGITEATFEDVAYVAQPVFPGIPHWIDKHVAMDDGRLVGIAIWATKPPAAPAAEAEPGSSFWGAPEHERGRMLSRIRELETALTAPSASQEALREALDLDKAVSTAALTWCGEKDRETFQSDVDYFKHNWRALPGLTAYVDRVLTAARAALAQSAAPVQPSRRDFWLHYDHQGAGRWCVENEPPRVIRPGAEVIHVREISPVQQAAPSGEEGE